MSSSCATAAAGGTTDTWDELLEALREAVDTRDAWARLAGLAEDETPGPAGAAVVSEAPDDWLDAQLFRKAG